MYLPPFRNKESANVLARFVNTKSFYFTAGYRAATCRFNVFPTVQARLLPAEQSCQGFIVRKLSTFRTESPYDLLGVSKSATQKEIKLAYYREAKKWHPDMIPNNPSAKERFQRITSAYELLMDDRRRGEFDRTGQTSSRATGSAGSQQQTQQHQQSYSNQQHAEDVFRSVQQDLEILLSAFRAYSEDIQALFPICLCRSAFKGCGHLTPMSVSIGNGILHTQP